MSLKSLPQSMISDIEKIIQESQELQKDRYHKVLLKALEEFQIKSVAEIKEEDKKRFDAWFRLALQEEENPYCDGCDRLKTDCICTKEDCGGCANEYPEKQKKANAQSGLPELGEDCSCAPCYGLTDTPNIGPTTVANELPKHADVIQDTDVLGVAGEPNSIKYRLMIQYPSGRVDFVPPLDLPGMVDKRSLHILCEPLPKYMEILGPAIENAAWMPSDMPQFKGNDKQ